MADEIVNRTHPKREDQYAVDKLTQSSAMFGVLYRGVVIDNVDPEELNRCKVIIEGITPSAVPPQDAKWAWSAATFGGGQISGQRYGSCFPWPIGSKVFILFEVSDDRYSSPVIIGGYFQKDRVPQHQFDRKKSGPDGKKNIPNAWGWVSPKGHSILCREEEDEEAIEFVSKGGRKIVISDKKDQELITLVGAKGGEIGLKEGKEGTVINMMTPKGESIVLDEKAKSITITARDTICITAKNVNIMSDNQYSNVSKNAILTSSQSITLAGLVQTNMGNVAGLVDVDANLITTTATTIKNYSVTTSNIAAGLISSTASGSISDSAGAMITQRAGGRYSITATNTSITSAIIFLTGQVISKG